MEIDKLLKKWDRYIKAKAFRMTNDIDHLDDLVQMGRIAIYQANLNYLPSKGKWESFMLAYVDGYMKNYLTNYSKTIKVPANKVNDISIPTISMETPTYEGLTIEDTIQDEVEDNSYDDEQLESVTRLNQVMELLKPQQKLIVRMYYQEEKTFAEIATAIGISKQAVSAQHKHILKKLKKNLDK